jgi:hypothetical protein
MSDRRPLSLDDHRLLGRELYEIRIFATSRLSVDLSNRYGTSKRVSRLAHRLHVDLDALRCELDSQLARDHPDDFDPRVYYPGTVA